MTVEKLNKISTELDVILRKIEDKRIEIEALWDRYWKLFNQLTDGISAEVTNEGVKASDIHETLNRKRGRNE